MPRDGAIVFSDLIGKLDVLRVSCRKCERDGCYKLNRLVERRGSFRGRDTVCSGRLVDSSRAHNCCCSRSLRNSHRRNRRVRDRV